MEIGILNPDNLDSLWLVYLFMQFKVWSENNRVLFVLLHLFFSKYSLTLFTDFFLWCFHITEQSRKFLLTNLFLCHWLQFRTYIRKNHTESSLGSVEAGRQSSNFWLQTGDLIRLSEQAHCYDKQTMSCLVTILILLGIFSYTHWKTLLQYSRLIVWPWNKCLECTISSKSKSVDIALTLDQDRCDISGREDSLANHCNDWTFVSML